MIFLLLLYISIIVMKRLSYKKNNKIRNKPLSKINGGRPPVEDNGGCREIRTLDGHNQSVESVAFHPTEPLLATGSLDNTVKLWRLSDDNLSATCVATLERHGTRSVYSVVFHRTAPLLASCGHDKTVRLWRLSDDNSSATCVATLEGHSSYVTSVVFHPKAPLLATCSWDRTAKLWRLSSDNSSATCVATLVGHSNYVTSVVFHPTKPLLATSSFDYTAKLWRCKILEGPYNNFILYPKITGVNESICNKLCPLCNINLCMKNVANPNNINGYIVKLTNGTASNDFYIHYKCIYRYLLNGHLTINDVSISSETIQNLLHIDNKADALIGADFYN